MFTLTVLEKSEQLDCPGVWYSREFSLFAFGVYGRITLEVWVLFNTALLQAVAWVAAAQVLTGGQKLKLNLNPAASAFPSKCKHDWGGQLKQNVVANIN